MCVCVCVSLGALVSPLINGFTARRGGESLGERGAGQCEGREARDGPWNRLWNFQCAPFCLPLCVVLKRYFYRLYFFPARVLKA